MSLKRFVMVSAFFVALTGSLLQAQGSFSGVWRVHIVRTDGTSEDRFLDLHQQGDKVTGAVIQNYRPRDITGTVTAGKLQVQFNVWRRVVDTYEAVLEGDTLKVTIIRKESRMRSPRSPLALESEAQSKPHVPRLPCRFRRCMMCRITGSRALHPWDGTAGTTSPTGLMTRPCASRQTPSQPRE